MTEKILTETGNERLSMLPIKHNDIWSAYKKAQACMWVAEEIDLQQDLNDWDKLNEDEKYFIKNVLAFFNQSDGIVNENLAENFYREVKYPEAKAFYGFQIMMENIHSETYGLLIDTLIKDEKEKQKLFNALDNFEGVKRKGEWALKWINSDSFVERLIAFAVVEGIFFSGSFCSIFWLKKRGLMQGLAFSNELISRDEGMHTQFAILLYNNHISTENKLSENKIKEIILSAVEAEKEFILRSLPVKLIGMNSDLMSQYIEYVADNLLLQLNCNKHFNSTNPFDFMENISIDNKDNFFEKRNPNYKKFELTGNNTNKNYTNDF